MTPRQNFWVRVIPSAAVIAIIFSVGVFVGNYRDANAMYVTRPEYDRHLHDETVREITDSLNRSFRRSQTDQRLDRIERILSHMTCKLMQECEP